MKNVFVVVVLMVLAFINTGSVEAVEHTPKPKILNIQSYGAIGDGVVMDTEAIQKTIDTCHAAGGGTVWVPAGEYVAGTLQLRSNVTLSLDHGASILGSQDHEDYPIKDLRPAAASYVGNKNSDIVDGKIRPDAPPAQLYDLESDVNQTKNLYNEYPEVVKQMRTLLRELR